VILDRRGREFLYWPLSEIPDGGVVELSLDDGTTWHPMTVADGRARVLLAGPEATSNPAGTVVLPIGRATATIRATAEPEVAYRDADVVDVR
jgi:hypothetical protein